MATTTSNKVNIFIGKNIEELTFTKGGYSQKEKQNLPFIIEDHKTIVVDVMSAAWEFPEERKHTHKLAQELVRQLKMIEYYDINIMTHSKTCIEVVSEFIVQGKLKPEQVSVTIISNDNKNIEQVCGFDRDGCLEEGWPIGFMSVDWQELEL
jgi:hypothetical protein